LSGSGYFAASVLVVVLEVEEGMAAVLVVFDLAEKDIVAGVVVVFSVKEEGVDVGVVVLEVEENGTAVVVVLLPSVKEGVMVLVEVLGAKEGVAGVVFSVKREAAAAVLVFIFACFSTRFHPFPSSGVAINLCPAIPPDKSSVNPLFFDSWGADGFC
jgi:hypothetical protein